MFNLNFCAGQCCLMVMEQNGRPCLVTGQRARQRAVKQEEILTALDCPRAQAALLFSLHRVSAEVTFDPRELICTKGLNGTQTKVRGDGARPPQIFINHESHVDGMSADQFPCDKRIHKGTIKEAVSHFVFIINLKRLIRENYWHDNPQHTPYFSPAVIFFLSCMMWVIMTRRTRMLSITITFTKQHPFACQPRH